MSEEICCKFKNFKTGWGWLHFVSMLGLWALIVFLGISMVNTFWLKILICCFAPPGALLIHVFFIVPLLTDAFPKISKSFCCNCGKDVEEDAIRCCHCGRWFKNLR